MKKVLSLFLTAAMIFSLVPVFHTAVKAADDNSSTTDIVSHVDTWQEMLQDLEQAYDNMYIRGLTIVLDKDITVDEDNYEAFNNNHMIEMNGDKLYVIDLNGHNISVQPGYGKAKTLFHVTDGAAFRIVDTKGYGEIYFDIDFEEYGDMIYVEDGSFCNYNCTLRMNNSPGSDIIYAGDGANVVLKGGSLINESNQSYGIWAQGNAKVTIGAGSIKTDSYCVHVEKRENLKIYGGWFELTGSWTNYPRIDVEDTNNKQDALKLYLAQDRNVYRYINWSNEDAPDLYNKAIDDVAENFGVCIDKTSTSYKHYCAWTPELKIEGTSVMVCDHFNEFIRMKRPEGTGKYKNIDLEITSIRADSGLPVGQSPKSPDGCFDVKCKDSNGYQWEISDSASSYWADSSDNKLSETHTVSETSSYILHLCVSPVDNDISEDDIDIDDVKQITFNGVPIAMGEYIRGELGASIYITVKLYPVQVKLPDKTEKWFCLQGQKVNISAPKVDGKHFKEWGGTYYTGAGAQSVQFDAPYAEGSSFSVPYSSFPVSITPYYEEHTEVQVSGIPATCTKDGMTDGVRCEVCDEEIVPQEKIWSLGHDYQEVEVIPPTCTEKGYTLYKCSRCDDTYKDSYVDALGHKFEGKTCTVCGAANPDYAEPTTNKPEQPKTITVGGIVYELNAVGEYVGAKAKRPSIKKAAKGKKSVKLTWKKVTGVSGYQIQCSTSKKFTKKTTKKVIVKGNKAKTFKKTIKKLKAKKKYFIRIRAYTTVQINGKSIKVYTGWSKIKKVKTK